MKTAIDSFEEALFLILQEAEDNGIYEVGTQNIKRYIEIIGRQNKQIEKEQIEDAFEYGWSARSAGSMKYGKQYYQEKYEKTK